MAYDLSQPRPMLPFPSLNPTLRPDVVPSPKSSSLASSTEEPRRAIALKLSEQVLERVNALMMQGRHAEKGAIRIDLGPEPVFIIDGVSYPLNLVEYGEPSVLVRSAKSAAAPLQPVAEIRHKASLKPGQDLQRIGHTLRENREAVEKEREGRRAVLLDSGVPLARSASLQRAQQSGSTSSRPASPAPPRQPSRLTAVPVKPPPSQLKAPPATKTSPSKRGPQPSKEAEPATAAATASTSEVHGSAQASAATAANGAGSPVSSASPAESSSSTSSTTSLVHSSSASASTGRTSLSSAGSPGTIAAVVSATANVRKAGGGGVMKGKDSLKKEKRKATDGVRSSPPVKSDADAKGKGKGKAKSIVKSAAIIKDDTSSSESDAKPLAASAVPKANGSSSSSATSKRPPPAVAAGSPSESEVATSARPSSGQQKKRKHLNGLDESGDEPGKSRAAAPASITVPSSSRAPTPISSPRLPPIPRIKRKTSASSLGSNKSAPAASSRKKSTSSSTRAEEQSKRGKKRRKEERWYSSSSDEDAEGEIDDTAVGTSMEIEEGEVAPSSNHLAVTDASQSRNKRRRTLSAPEGEMLPGADDGRGRPSALPSHMAANGSGRKSAPGSPLRASLVAPPTSTHSYPATLPPGMSYSALTSHFNALYKTYAALHHLLMCEKLALEGGEPGDFELATTTKMVRRLESVRLELEGTKARLREWKKE